jgi:hypothetical protein
MNASLQFQSKFSEFGSEFVVTRGPELIADEYEGGGGGGGAVSIQRWRTSRK